MTKSLLLAFLTILILPACTQEAAAPVQEEEIPDQSLPDDSMSSDTMPDGVVQDENGVAAGTTDSMGGVTPAEEDAKAAMEMTEKPPESDNAITALDPDE